MNRAIKNLPMSFVSMIFILLAACNIDFGAVGEKDSLKNLQYNKAHLSLGNDARGVSTLRGTGPLFVKNALTTEASVVQIRVKAGFTAVDSVLTIYSHTKDDYTKGYEFRFARLGNSLRLITSLNALNPNSLGIVAANVTDWAQPLEFVIQVDNTQSSPNAKIWSINGDFDVSAAATLSEDRHEAYPEGKRVGANQNNLSLHSLRVIEVR